MEHFVGRNQFTSNANKWFKNAFKVWRFLFSFASLYKTQPLVCSDTPKYSKRWWTFPRRKILTDWHGLPMNLVCPTSVISQSFNAAIQIHEESVQEGFASVHGLQSLKAKRYSNRFNSCEPILGILKHKVIMFYSKSVWNRHFYWAVRKPRSFRELQIWYETTVFMCAARCQELNAHWEFAGPEMKR